VRPSAASDPAAGSAAVLTLTPDAVARAGIETAAVRLGAPSRRVNVPGLVEPNAYQQVLVTALSAGQVQSVSAELGAFVRPGQPLATIHSPELAEAERVYISVRAELTAAEQRLARAEELVKIGAASRQELEAARADRTTRATDVQGARARLQLLGLSPDALAGLVDPNRIDPVLTVAAPAAGLITRRAINRGQNVEAATELFTIIDVSTVWVVGSLFERDLARVRVGSPATMTSAAIPGETWRGVVTYIDPRMAPETRSALLRVETPNPGARLRLGMFLEMVVEDASPARLLLVQRSAVQTIGSVTVVYVADASQPGRFVERPVRLGLASGDEVAVIEGLADGERVVIAGAFFLRAERDRLGLPPPQPAPDAVGEGGRVFRPGSTPPPARIEIAVTKAGFVPDRVVVAAGHPTDLVFTRTTNETCATEVLVPSPKVRKALPLNRPVAIRLRPSNRRDRFRVRHEHVERHGHRSMKEWRCV
jgi:RND family efflux transporter MFP subunit